MRSIAVSPSDSNVLLAGTNGAGVFLSKDGGATWSAVNNGVSNLYIAQIIAFNGSDPNTAYLPTFGGGVFVTHDLGSHWATLDSGFASAASVNVTAIAASPARALILYAASSTQGVFTRTVKPVPQDFDGDGCTDLLWSNASGAASTWLMNGLAPLSQVSTGPFTGWTVSPGRSVP